MSQEKNILTRVRAIAGEVQSWADFSNALFDPKSGIIAEYYPNEADRKEFLKTSVFKEIRQLLQASMTKFGVVEGAKPKKSGKFVVRLPVSLHEALDREAKQEKVSLNQLVVAKLACRLDFLSGRTEAIVIQAYLEVRFLGPNETASTDRVIAQPDLNLRFLRRCRELGAQGTDFDLNWILFNARKSRLLTGVPQATKLHLPNADEISFASEMGLALVQRQSTEVERNALTLDRILCDPELAMQFDRHASRLAPGFSPLDYRWAALGLRKAGRYKKSASEIDAPEFVPVGAVNNIKLTSVPEASGLYLLASHDAAMYVGETENLRKRIKTHLDTSESQGIPEWVFGRRIPLDLSIAVMADAGVKLRYAAELRVVSELKPELNYLLKVA